MSEKHLEITDGELEELLADLPGIHLTPDFLRSQILKTEYLLWPPGSVQTVCALTLKNGYVLHGHSACVAPENYREEIGRRVAFDNAFNQLWALYGFCLKQKLHRQGKG